MTGNEKNVFPKGFTCGTATASYQIEGAVKQDGRGETIWDRFCQNPANNNSFKAKAPIPETDFDEGRFMLDVNALGPIRIIKAVLPMLLSGSAVINISSEAGSISGG